MYIPTIGRSIRVMKLLHNCGSSRHPTSLRSVGMIVHIRTQLLGYRLTKLGTKSAAIKGITISDP